MEIEEKQKRSANKYWRTVKGNLYARLQYREESGKTREKLERITDKRVARATVERMRTELASHGEQSLQTDKITFKQMAEKYSTAKVFPAVIRDGVKVSGLKSSKPVATYVKVATEFFGSKRLRSIKASDIEKFKNKRLDTPVTREINVTVLYVDENGHEKKRTEKQIKSTVRKVASVNRELATLRSMLNFAEEERYILRNPFPKKIISMAAETERERILSDEEETRLLAQCIGKRSHLKPILICALDTAMRPDEMFKMTWADVDFDFSTITVRISNSKTEKARTVWMSSRLKAELSNLWELSPKELDSSVFGTRSVKKAFRTACSLAGVEGFRFRDTRHAGTTRMILAGYSHAEVMKVTGHSQIKTFLRYLNLTPEAISEKASLLDRYLERNTKPTEISEAVN